MCPHIVGVNNPLVGMISWSPCSKGTQVFFVLSLKFLSVDPKETSNGMAIGSAVIY